MKELFLKIWNGSTEDAVVAIIVILFAVMFIGLVVKMVRDIVDD